MPIIRKVVTVGGSKGITLPKSWIDFFENDTGQELKEVIMEVNGSIVIHPRKTKEA